MNESGKTFDILSNCLQDLDRGPTPAREIVTDNYHLI